MEAQRSPGFALDLLGTSRSHSPSCNALVCREETVTEGHAEGDGCKRMGISSQASVALGPLTPLHVTFCLLL